MPVPILGFVVVIAETNPGERKYRVFASYRAMIHHQVRHIRVFGRLDRAERYAARLAKRWHALAIERYV